MNYFFYISGIAFFICCFIWRPQKQCQSKPLIRSNWHEYWLNIASSVSSRSPDPKKQVGCVLTSNNRIICTGYNGLPTRINEDIFDWTNRDRIKKIIIHAECNCLLYSNAKDLSKNYDNLVLYCTLSPCIDCLKLIKTCNSK